MKYLITLCIFLSTVSLNANPVDSILSVSDTIVNIEERVDWIVGVGYDYYMIDPDVTEALGLTALDWSIANGYRYGEGRAHHILGIAYWTIGLLEKGLEENIAALKIYEELENERFIQLIKLNNSNIYSNLGDHEKSSQVLREIIKQAEIRQDTQMLAFALNNIGINFRRLEQYDSAMYYLKKDLPYVGILGDTVGLALIQNNIAVALEHMKKHNQALLHLDTARGYLQRHESQKRLAEVYVNYGANLAALERYDLQKKYLDSARLVAEGIKSKVILEQVYLGYADYFYVIEDYKNSLDHYEKSVDIKDSIRSAEVKKEIEIVQLKYEDEKKQNKIILLEKEQAEEEFKFMTTSIVGGALVAILLLLVYILRLRVARSKFREQQLKKELEHKSKELNSYALNFIQKNELMHELTEKIEDLKKKSDTSSIKELNQMNGIINNSFKIDQDWDNFKIMFEDLHEGFFTRLKTHYPDISNAELKLCALLRLNLNLKESSRILGISSDSVKTARYRLRKKLGLATEDNLLDWMIRFESKKTLAVA